MADLQQEKGLVLDFLNNIDKAENKLLADSFRVEHEEVDAERQVKDENEHNQN